MLLNFNLIHRIGQFESSNNVRAVFPPVSDESSTVLLVFEGAEDSLPKDKKQKEAKLTEALSKAASAISELAKEAADVKTETLTVDQVGHCG